MPFHYVATTNLATGSYAFNVVPAGFPRIGTEADGWAHYRLKRLQFRLHRVTAITGPQMVAFTGGIQDTAVTTVAQASEVLSSAFLSPLQTVPTEWVHVSKLELAGPLPWYKTVAGTADPTEESPGAISVVGTGSETFYLEYRGIFEFKVSLATANTPAALRLRNEVREERLRRYTESERAILLRILGSIPRPDSAGVKLNP